MEKTFLSKKGFIGDTAYDVRISVEVTKMSDRKDYIVPSADITFFGSNGSVTLSFDNWKRDWDTFDLKGCKKLIDLVYTFSDALDDAAVYLDDVKKKSEKKG